MHKAITHTVTNHTTSIIIEHVQNADGTFNVYLRNCLYHALDEIVLFDTFSEFPVKIKLLRCNWWMEHVVNYNLTYTYTRTLL